MNTMKQILIIATVMLLPLFAISQNAGPKFDIRFGFGTSFLGTGDMRAVTIENELNYAFSRYFTSSFGLSFGKSIYGVYESASFIQGNLNIYISPLKNNRRNDFRIGTGLSYNLVSNYYKESERYENGVLVYESYKVENTNAIGLNLILEDTFSITDKFFVGAKVFLQPYRNGDINRGILMKTGLRL